MTKLKLSVKVIKMGNSYGILIPRAFIKHKMLIPYHEYDLALKEKIKKAAEDSSYTAGPYNSLVDSAVSSLGSFHVSS